MCFAHKLKVESRKFKDFSFDFILYKLFTCAWSARGNRDDTLEFFTSGSSIEDDVKNLKEVTNPKVSRTALEQPAKEGESPVSENFWTSVLLPE